MTQGCCSSPRLTKSGASDKLVHYIRAGSTVAIFTKIDDSDPGTDKTRYLHRDHLDSIVAITDETGRERDRFKSKGFET